MGIFYNKQVRDFPFDEELLKYTVDYIAFSYYRSNTVKTGIFDYERPACDCVNEQQIQNPHCEANEWHWEIDPVGFRWTLNDLHHRTGLPVFVLENGIGWREDMTQEEYRKAAVDAVKKLSADVGIPADLKEIVKEEDIQFLAESAYADACAPGNPKDASVEDIIGLYKSLL